MTERMPLLYKIALIVIVLGCLLVVFLVGRGVYRSITGHSIAPAVISQPNPAPDTIIGQVERIQRALKATGIPRYDPCEIDDDPGPHFRRAYTNKKKDELYKKMISRMAGKPK